VRHVLHILQIEVLFIIDRLFASLASDKSPMIPYSRDIADQRRKYGDNMLRKGDEHLASQRQFEAEGQARIDAARRKRQDEKERQEALEVSRHQQ
jgi:RNA polymerase-associated protein CTR9